MFMSRRAVIFGLAGMAIAPAVSVGQEESETAALLDQLPGLEAAWAKRYDHPNRHRHDDHATPAATDLMTRQLSATILAFDTEANATITFAMGLNEEIAGTLLSAELSSFAPPQDLDLGGQATLFVASEDGEMSALLAIRDGNLGYLVTAWGEDEDVVGSVRAVGQFMVEAAPGNDQIVFEEFGESHGGLFDLFPQSGDPALDGLIPMYEYDLLVSESPLEYPATPAT